MSSEKTTSITTETAADGTETVSEISTTVTEVAADGTETVSEITTAQGDDPSTMEGSVVVTETAPDGTETVVEYSTTNVDAAASGDEDETLFEQVVEAVLDVEIGNEADGAAITAVSTGGDTEIYIAESDLDADPTGAEFAAGDEVLLPDVSPDATATTPFVMVATPDAASGFAAPVFSATTTTDEAAFTSSSEAVDAEAAAATDAHAQAATDAQQQADEFIASGDYEAAAQARGVAENEAWEASDDSMLSAYDASDLTLAAEKQDEATDYSAQQAGFAQQGNYEAAREAADNAAYATSEADFSAGGADHTGQADAEKYNMDWAVHQEKQADHYADNAAAYAADGDMENAERSAATAAEYQASADHYGDLGEHGGVIADYDPSSEVASGGTYESTYDSTAATVDTGYDAGAADIPISSGYDAGTDDV